MDLTVILPLMRLRLSFWALVLCLLLSGCRHTGKEQPAISGSEIAQILDSIDMYSPLPDHQEEEIPSRIADRVDEVFGDFILGFSSSESFQKKRVRFPVSFFLKDSVRHVDSSEWEHVPLLSTLDTYTLLFDNEQEMDLEGDMGQRSVQLEWIDMDSLSVSKYYFQRDSLGWMLEGVNFRPLEQDDEEGFAEFYRQFSRDSVYQTAHVAARWDFVTMDPDDEFNIIKTRMDRDQWPAFRPDLPRDVLTNINYGQSNEDLSKVKILKVCGIDNGFSVVLYFRSRMGTWELYKFEDTSI